MCLQEYIDYLKANLTAPADRFKCLCHLESLRPCLSNDEVQYAISMLDRWIRVGMFNGAISIGHQHVEAVQRDAPNPATKRLAEMDDSSAKRQRF